MNMRSNFWNHSIIIIYFSYSALSSIFIDLHNHSVIQQIRLLFPFAMVIHSFDSVRGIVTGSLRGLLETKYSMKVSLVSLWLVGIPLSVLFGFIIHMNLFGVLLGYGLGIAIAALLLINHWFNKKIIELTVNFNATHTS